MRRNERVAKMSKEEILIQQCRQVMRRCNQLREELNEAEREKHSLFVKIFKLRGQE